VHIQMTADACHGTCTYTLTDESHIHQTHYLSSLSLSLTYTHHIQNTCVHTHIYFYTYTSVHTFTHVRTHSCIHKCTHLVIVVFKYIYIYLSNSYYRYHNTFSLLAQ
jgi:hypothetical protein